LLNDLADAYDSFVSRLWSQTELGERCGFYQTYLSRIENGQANPTLNAMEVIANGLGMTIYDFWDYVKKKHVGVTDGSFTGRWRGVPRRMAPPHSRVSHATGRDRGCAGSGGAASGACGL
jgi:DNA-binding XRE family transcriptional regulator